MKTFKTGLVHTLITPFRKDFEIDFDTYAKLIEFHLKNGADALAIPAPEGEDINLKDNEQRKMIEFVISQVNQRVPVIAHVSDAGTQIAVDRAKFAEQAGASAIVSHPPYFWHPKPEMVLEHLVRIGSAIDLPFLVYSPVVETAGTKISTEIVLELINKLDNFVGLVDMGMGWVFMIESISNGRKLNPAFQLITGTDYMVSPFLIGASGSFSALSSIAPKLVRKVYDLCCKESFFDARQGQEELALLRTTLKKPRLEVGIKLASKILERDCGDPRPPFLPLSRDESLKLEACIKSFDFMNNEPTGW